jgi:ribosomal protein S19E (S16A)
METLRFKARVRQLKELGLTESLDVGYRLSPRGRALLRRLGREPALAPRATWSERGPG